MPIFEIDSPRSEENSVYESSLKPREDYFPFEPTSATPHELLDFLQNPLNTFKMHKVQGGTWTHFGARLSEKTGIEGIYVTEEDPYKNVEGGEILTAFFGER